MGTQQSVDRTYPRHAEASAELPAGPQEVFDFLDDHQGAYRLGFRIAPRVPAGSTLTVLIDYDLPSRPRWLGRLGGSKYADWCVQQMLGSARFHFT